MVETGACDGARGGMRAWDNLPHFKRLNLICLGARGSLENIGNKKTESRLKFAQNMQAKPLLGLLSNTSCVTKLGGSLDEMGLTLMSYGVRDIVWGCFTQEWAVLKKNHG